MENKENRDVLQNSTSNNDWQQQENISNEQHKFADNDEVDLKSAEANGYGAEEKSIYASSTDPDRRDDEKNDDDEDDDTDLEDEEESKSDWGSVDPLEDEGGLSSDMDPSGPGSAV